MLFLEFNQLYRRSPGRATITEHSPPMTPSGRANKPCQAVHMQQTEEMLNNQPSPQRDGNIARHKSSKQQRDNHHENMPI